MANLKIHKPRNEHSYGYFIPTYKSNYYLNTEGKVVKATPENSSKGGSLYFKTKEDAQEAYDTYNAPTIDLSDIY